MFTHWMYKIGQMALLASVLAACAGIGSEPLGEAGQVVTVTGTVRSVDTSEMAVDGPGRIQLRTDRHGDVLVLVSSCMGPCSLESVERLFQMRSGQRWRARGEVREDGSLVIYDEANHELERAPLQPGS